MEPTNNLKSIRQQAHLWRHANPKADIETAFVAGFATLRSEMKKTEPVCIGISWLWALPDNHPFYDAARRHDLAYDALKPGASTRLIDAEFFWRCWEVAKRKKSATLKAEAIFFYGICRAWGKMRQVFPCKNHTPYEGMRRDGLP